MFHLDVCSLIFSTPIVVLFKSELLRVYTLNRNLSRLDFSIKKTWMKCLRIQYIIKTIDFPIQASIRQDSFVKKFFFLKLHLSIQFLIFLTWLFKDFLLIFLFKMNQVIIENLTDICLKMTRIQIGRFVHKITQPFLLSVHFASLIHYGHPTILHFWRCILSDAGTDSPNIWQTS